MTRTIQNYQKAYRKKVEGLKAELRSARGEAAALQGQVTRLSRRLRLHAPSLAAGALLGALAMQLWRRFKPAGGGTPTARAAALAPAASDAAPSTPMAFEDDAVLAGSGSDGEGAEAGHT